MCQTAPFPCLTRGQGDLANTLETILHRQVHPVGMTSVAVEIRTPAAQVFGSDLQVGSNVPEQSGVEILPVAVLIGRSSGITVMAIEA